MLRKLSFIVFLCLFFLEARASDSDGPFNFAGIHFIGAGGRAVGQSLEAQFELDSERSVEQEKSFLGVSCRLACADVLTKNLLRACSNPHFLEKTSVIEELDEKEVFHPAGVNVVLGQLLDKMLEKYAAYLDDGGMMGPALVASLNRNKGNMVQAILRGATPLPYPATERGAAADSQAQWLFPSACRIKAVFQEAGVDPDFCKITRVHTRLGQRMMKSSIGIGVDLGVTISTAFFDYQKEAGEEKLSIVQEKHREIMDGILRELVLAEGE